MIVEASDLKKTALALKKIVSGGVDADGKGVIKGWFWMTRVPKAVDVDEEPILLVTLQGKDKSGAVLKSESKKIRQKIGKTKFTKGYLAYEDGMLKFFGDKNLTGFKGMLSILSVTMKFGKLKSGRLFLGEDEEIADNEEIDENSPKGQDLSQQAQALKEKYASILTDLEDFSDENAIVPMTQAEVNAYLAEDGVAEALTGLEAQLSEFLRSDDDDSMDKEREERIGGKQSIKSKMSKLFSSSKTTYANVLDGLEALEGDLTDAQRTEKITQLSANIQQWLSGHPEDRTGIRALSLNMLQKELNEDQERLLLKEYATAADARKTAIKDEIFALNYKAQVCENNLSLGMTTGLAEIVKRVESARDHKRAVIKHAANPKKQQASFEALKEDIDDGLYLIDQFRATNVSDEQAQLLTQYENELNMHEYEAQEQIPDSVNSPRLSRYLIRNGRQKLEQNKKAILEKQQIVAQKSAGNDVEKAEAVILTEEILILERELHVNENILIKMQARRQPPFDDVGDSINGDFNVLIQDINRTIMDVSQNAITHLKSTMSSPRKRAKARAEMLEFIDNMFDALNPGRMLVGGKLRPVTNSGLDYNATSSEAEASELHEGELDKGVLGKLETRVDYINRKLEALSDLQRQEPPPANIEEINQKAESYRALLDACQFAVMPANAFDGVSDQINATRAWNKSMQTRLNKLRRRQKMATGQDKEDLTAELEALERLTHKLQKDKRSKMRDMLTEQRDTATQAAVNAQAELRVLNTENDALLDEVRGKREVLRAELEKLSPGHPLRLKAERHAELERSVVSRKQRVDEKTAELALLLNQVGRDPATKNMMSLPEKPDPMTQEAEAKYLAQTQRSLKDIHVHLIQGGQYSAEVSKVIEELFDAVNNLAIERSERDASWNTIKLMAEENPSVENLQESLAELFKRQTEIDPSGFLFPRENDRINELNRLLNVYKGLPEDNEFRVSVIDEVNTLQDLLQAQNTIYGPINYQYNRKLNDLNKIKQDTQALNPEDSETIEANNQRIATITSEILEMVKRAGDVKNAVTALGNKIAFLEARYLKVSTPTLSQAVKDAASTLKTSEEEQIKKTQELSKKQVILNTAVETAAHSTTDLLLHEQSNQLQETLSTNPKLQKDLGLLKEFDQELMGIDVFGNWNFLVWEGGDAGHYTVGEEISKKLKKKNQSLSNDEMIQELRQYLTRARNELPELERELDEVFARIKDNIDSESRVMMNGAEREQRSLEERIARLDKDAPDHDAQLKALSEAWNAEEKIIQNIMNANAATHAMSIELNQKRGALRTLQALESNAKNILAEAEKKNAQWIINKKSVIADLLVQVQVQALARSSNRVMASMSGILRGHQSGMDYRENSSSQEVDAQRLAFVESATASLVSTIADKVALRDDVATVEADRERLATEIQSLEAQLLSEKNSLVQTFNAQLESNSGSLTQHPDELIFAWSQIPELFQPPQIRAQSEAYYKYQEVFGEEDDRLRYEGMPSRAENLRNIAKSLHKVSGDELLQGKWSELVDNYASDITRNSHDRSKELPLERLQAFTEVSEIPMTVADIVIDVPDVLASDWGNLLEHDFAAKTPEELQNSLNESVFGMGGQGFGMSESGLVDSSQEQISGAVSGAIGVLSMYTIYREKKRNQEALAGMGKDVPDEYRALEVMLEEEVARNIEEMLEKGIDVTKTLCNLIPILGKGAVAIANGVELVNIIRKATVHYCKKHKDRLTLEASQEEGNMLSNSIENVRNAQAREAAMDTIDGILKSIEIAGNVLELTPLAAIGQCVEALAGVAQAVKTTIEFVYNSSLAKKIRVLRRRAKQGDPEAQEEIFRYGFAESSGLIAIAIQENDPIAMKFVNSRLGSTGKWVGPVYNAIAQKSGVKESDLKSCSASICRQWVLAVDDHELFDQESPWDNFKQMFKNVKGIESRWSNLQEFRWSLDAYNDQITKNTNNIYTTSTQYSKNKANLALAHSLLERVMPSLQESEELCRHLEVVIQSALIDMDELSVDISEFNKVAQNSDVLRLLNRRDLEPSSSESSFKISIENTLRSLTDTQQRVNVQLRYLGTMHEKIDQQIGVLNGFTQTDSSIAILNEIESLQAEIANLKDVELVALNAAKSEIEDRLNAEAEAAAKVPIQAELDAKNTEIQQKQADLTSKNKELAALNKGLIENRDANQKRLAQQQKLLNVLSRVNLQTASTFKIFQDLPVPYRVLV